MAEKKSKKSAGNKKLRIFLFIVLVLLFAAWYLCGKPSVYVSEEGIVVELTEEPIINRFLNKNKPEVSENQENQTDQTRINQNETAETEKTDSQKKQTAEGNSPVKTRTVSKAAGGKEYSFEGDLNHPENSPLYFGNPSDCVADVKNGDNYLMEKKQFTICYNNDNLSPNWVAWHLSTEDFGDADRSNKFIPDKELPSNWEAITSKDYQYNSYGFDRGHVCPSADRTATQDDNNITFLMTNMMPQAPDCNRIVWMHLETYERQLAEEGNEVYIIAGPAGTGGTGDKGYFTEIPVTTKDGRQLAIKVPEYSWKVMLVLPSGDDDLNRVKDKAYMIGACIPNKQGIAKEGDWDHYVCSVDYIEELTGYDFFELLPDDIEADLEDDIYGQN